MEPTGMNKGRLEQILERLRAGEEITPSDKELLKLTQEDPRLTVVQSDEDFDWEKSEGAFYNIVAERSFDKPAVSALNEVLDISQVSLSALAKLGKTYVIKGGLEYRDGESNKKLSSADLKLAYLDISITDKKGNAFDLSGYKLNKSGRSREFYGYMDQGAREIGIDTGPVFNQTSVSATFSGRDNFSIVYRMTFNGKELVGSRLYMDKDGERTSLDESYNQTLVLFMRSLNEIHDNRFTETSCTTVNVTEAVGKAPQKPKKESSFIPGYA